MTKITREERLLGTAAIDLVRQTGADVTSAEVRSAQKLEDPQAFGELSKLIDPWRTAKDGPKAEAEKYLRGLAARMNLDPQDGLEQIAHRVEQAIHRAVQLDADPGVWGHTPRESETGGNGWRLMDRIRTQLRSLRGTKSQWIGAMEDAMKAAAQTLHDRAVISELARKSALQVTLSPTEKAELIAIRDRLHTDFTMAIEDPEKARRYLKNGIGEERALEAIAYYGQIQRILGEPVSEAGLNKLRRQVYESILGAFLNRLEKTVNEQASGWAEQNLIELDHQIPRALAARKRLGVELSTDLLQRLAEHQGDSPQRRELERMKEEKNAAFWRERGEERPYADRKTVEEMSNQDLVTSKYGIRPWEILDQIETRGGLEKAGISPDQLKTALTNTIAFYFDLQVFSENSLSILLNQWNPFLADKVEERLARVDQCRAIMSDHGITERDLDTADVMLHYSMADMTKEIERVRAALPELRAAAAQETA